jgi:hypothetical protein
MASRTQIVCLHEGTKGSSVDPVFINRLIKSLNPSWLRNTGSNRIRLVPKGGRASLIEEMPVELKACLSQGGHTTLMVFADVDDDMSNCDSLKNEFWRVAKSKEITKEQFDQVVLIFAKDRIENWIEYLNTGRTDESEEGPRVKHAREATEAAKTLATRCRDNLTEPPLPPSLLWSCRNWRELSERMS